MGKLLSKTMGNVPSNTMGNVLSTTIGKVLAIYNKSTKLPTERGEHQKISGIEAQKE